MHKHATIGAARASTGTETITGKNKFQTASVMQMLSTPYRCHQMACQ
jgi:hypothetical protein